MKRRSTLLPLIALLLSGCAFWRVDLTSPYVRSELVDSPEKEAEILGKARLERTDDGRVRVLYVQGTPYEIGYQHGALLRKEVQDNLGYLYEEALSQFYAPEIFDEAYERMRPYIPQEYVEEMHGLAHGSKLPLRVVHAIHALPEIGEWGGKKKISKIVKKMMRGELGTSCSNISAVGSATSDGKPYVVRILDWGLHRISKLHQYPLLVVAKPESGVPYVNVGWVGFLGAVSGMNAEGVTLGEMGYGDPENETLRGRPMPFLLRDVLSKTKSLDEVREVLRTSPGTNSFVFLMNDGKTGEGELYIKDRERFLVFPQGSEVSDGGRSLQAIPEMVYGGHKNDVIATLLQEHWGRVSPELLMNVLIPKIAMKINFQNVVYSPSDLRLWVNNAASKKVWAAEQPYTYFDLKRALSRFDN